MYRIPAKIKRRVPAAALEFARSMNYDGRWQIGFDELSGGQIWLIGGRGSTGFPLFKLLPDAATAEDYDRKFHGEYLQSEAWTVAQWLVANTVWRPDGEPKCQ